MSKSTRFKCPNCDKRHAFVLDGDVEGRDQAEFECPNCEEPVVVRYTD